MYLKLNSKDRLQFGVLFTLDEVDTIILGLEKLKTSKADILQTELFHLKAKAKIKGKRTYGETKKL
jgi:hypothetical protein|tara:strand:+ start:954 stop:1151 length:198 start_codon:yes stop_codon:yes gene_type:complete